MMFVDVEEELDAHQQNGIWALLDTRVIGHKWVSH